MPAPGAFLTTRLRAERLRPDHLDFLRLMHGNRQVMATLGGTIPDCGTEQFLGKALAHWEAHGFGPWVLCDREGGSLAGRAGLDRVSLDGRDEVELAYALMPGFWGRGLATEAAQAVVTIGFEQLALPEIVAFTLPDNRASRRVMEKVGLRYERDIVRAALPHVLYRLTAPARGCRP